MHAQLFDTISRSAAQGAGRRALLATGGAGLLTAMGGTVTGAKKKKNKAKKKCNQQKAACEDSVAEFCAAATDNPVDEQECLNDITPCCAQCNVDFGVSCILNLLSM